MAKSVEAVRTQFHAFLKQRNNKTNAAVQEAQRLVNLYRVLGAFGTDFVNQYNAMLLAASDEVQMALNALVAGHEVRQYLEFLRLEQNKAEEQSEKATAKTGWLPPPEEEMATSGAASQSPALQDLMQAEEEKFKLMISELKLEQEKALKRMFDQLSGSLQLKAADVASAPSVPPVYSEIIEEKNKEK